MKIIQKNSEFKGAVGAKNPASKELTFGDSIKVFRHKSKSVTK